MRDRERDDWIDSGRNIRRRHGRRDRWRIDRRGYSRKVRGRYVR